MKNERTQNLIRLGIVAGAVLLGLLIGQLTGNLDTVLTILKGLTLFLIGITILVVVHELGHFLTAKAFGMRVEVFSVGFPPKVFSMKRGDTEYQVGATPLGGYVKISGMIDESMDTGYLAQAPQPWEFRSKPVWQRMIVMCGGVVMNVILGILIFTGMKLVFNDIRIPVSEAKYGIEVISSVPSLGSVLGFRTGDTLVSFMGRSFPYFEEYTRQENLLKDGAYYEVRRAGQLTRIDIPGDVQNLFSVDSIESTLFVPDIPAVIRVDEPGSAGNEPLAPAYTAGLRTGDRIIRIDTVPVFLFSELRAYMAGKRSQQIGITYLRAGDTLQTVVQSNDKAQLGVRPGIAQAIRLDTVRYGLLGALGAGTREAFGFVSANAQGLSNLTRPGVDASRSVMGPLQIVKVYLEAFTAGGIVSFLRLTAILSMILAFVNILPIPALDGGHLVFLLIEAVTRREPSVRVRMIAQQVGFFLILGLMLLVFFNDALRLIVN